MADTETVSVPTDAVVRMLERAGEAMALLREAVENDDPGSQAELRYVLGDEWLARSNALVVDWAAQIDSVVEATGYQIDK